MVINSTMADEATKGRGAASGILDGQAPAADVLATGFGTAVAMWAVGYVLRLPPAWAPGWLLLVLMLLCLVLGGLIAGRTSGRGLQGGVFTGLVAGVLNLLILGSLLSHPERPNAIVPSAAWWLPGSLLVSAVLAAAGAAVGGRSVRRQPVNWVGVFGLVVVAATMLLIIAGGVVTGYEAGLAVVDWPNSFGYNMFLYPLSRMTGGIYYEHAHRLFGSLVGLATIVYAVLLWYNDRRGWVRGLGVAAVALVIVQGILGGLRVTGRLTLSTRLEDMAPSTLLAVVHGVVGQVFLGLLVALVLVTSTYWIKNRTAAPKGKHATDRTLGWVLVFVLVLQLVLGAVQRHYAEGILVHIGMAMVVTVLALVLGARAWGLYEQNRMVSRLGVALLVLLAVQLVLGLAAFVATGMFSGDNVVTSFEVLVTTAHQATGALMLAGTVALSVSLYRQVAAEVVA